MRNPGLALLLSYPVRWLERLRLGRLLAITLVVLGAIVAIGLLGVAVIPLVLDQANQLLTALPEWLDEAVQRLSWLEQLAQRYRLEMNFESFSAQVQQLSQGVVSWLPGLAIGTVGRLIDTLLVFVLSVYMLLYGQQLWQGLMRLLPARLGAALGRSLRFNFQQFFISQVFLALFMLLGLIPIFMLLRVKFALLFALIIGIFEIIPFVGAALGISLVTLLTLLQGFWVAFWVALLAILLQQVKDNLLAPRVLGQFIGLNPVWVFIALLAGARVGGVLGVLLAIPIAGTIKSTVEQLRPVKTAGGVESPKVLAADSLVPRDSL